MRGRLHSVVPRYTALPLALHVLPGQKKCGATSHPRPTPPKKHYTLAGRSSRTSELKLTGSKSRLKMKELLL